MDKQKYVPYCLLGLYGLKSLIYTPTWESAAIIAALGITSFLCDKFIQSTEIVKCITKINEQTRAIAEMQRDVEQTKSYVTGMKLNGLQALKPNAINRTAP